MADTPDVMHEVGEDMRRQQLESFWKENGAWIIGSIILAIIATAAISYWREFDFKKDMAVTSELLLMMDASDPEQLTAFAGKSDKDHAVIARFVAANAYITKKELEKAVDIYQGIANTSGIDDSYRDLARLLSIGQRLGGGDSETLHRELAELQGNGGTWRASALEMEAVLYAQEKKMKEAADIWGQIAVDITAPDAVRARAEAMRELYLDHAAGK